MTVESTCDPLAEQIRVCVQSLENIPNALVFKILPWTERLCL